MIYEKWDVLIDKKWRLSLPNVFGKNIKTGETLYLYEGIKGRCVKISMFPFIGKGKGNFIVNHAVEVRKGTNSRSKRVIIPKELRRSDSFYFGRMVSLVLKNETNDTADFFVEIWPRKISVPTFFF